MATFFHVILARIRAFLRQGDLEQDFEQELKAHLAMAEEDKIRAAERSGFDRPWERSPGVCWRVSSGVPSPRWQAARSPVCWRRFS